MEEISRHILVHPNTLTHSLVSCYSSRQHILRPLTYKCCNKDNGETMTRPCPETRGSLFRHFLSCYIRSLIVWGDGSETGSPESRPRSCREQGSGTGLVRLKIFSSWTHPTKSYDTENGGARAIKNSREIVFWQERRVLFWFRGQPLRRALWECGRRSRPPRSAEDASVDGGGGLGVLP